MAKADAEIAEKVKAGEKTIADIRTNAMASVEEIAKATASEIVVALGGSADDKSVDAIVKAQLKG
jgi:F-type H+-transporting ATPase subunit b